MGLALLCAVLYFALGGPSKSASNRVFFTFIALLGMFSGMGSCINAMMGAN